MKRETFYLIEFENGVKFGRSANFPQRLAAYKNPWCREIKNIYRKRCDHSSTMEHYLKRRYLKRIKPGTREFIINVSFDELVKTSDIIIDCLTKGLPFPKELIVPTETLCGVSKQYL